MGFTNNTMCALPGQGLYYRDDDALVAEVFDEDYKEKNFSSIPDEVACDRNSNRIMGEPQPPINALTAELRMYKAQQKAYTYGHRCKPLNSLSAVDMNTSDDGIYWGSISPHQFDASCSALAANDRSHLCQEGHSADPHC